MSKLEIEEYIKSLSTQVLLLRAQIGALQEIFFAYLATEHNDKHPNFSENVKAEYIDVFGNKLFGSFELLPVHDPIAEKIREEISQQLQILKMDLDDIEDSLKQ